MTTWLSDPFDSRWQANDDLRPDEADARAALIARLEKTGRLDPTCDECKRHLYPAEDPGNVWYPNHRALVSCQSGKRAHCTCDTCF